MTTEKAYTIRFYLEDRRVGGLIEDVSVFTDGAPGEAFARGQGMVAVKYPHGRIYGGEIVRCEVAR
jgi:hypothetical protein